MFGQPLSIFQFILSHRPLNILNQLIQISDMYVFWVESTPGRQGIKDNLNFDKNVTWMRHRIAVEADTFPWLTTYLKGSSFSSFQSFQVFIFSVFNICRVFFFSVFVFSRPVRTQHVKPTCCKGFTEVRSKIQEIKIPKHKDKIWKSRCRNT